MQYSTHYNLNLVEGTDLVNPLSVDKPNYQAIDTAMYNNSIHAIDTATCVKSGTVHAITRTNTDCEVFKFTATGNWVTGDTMTVDGGAVTVYLPSGEAPLTGAYVINSEVLCLLKGTRVTLLAKENDYIPDASEIIYTGTTTVKDELDKDGTYIDLVGITPLEPDDTITLTQEQLDLILSNKYIAQLVINHRSDNASSSRFYYLGKIGAMMGVLYKDRTNVTAGAINIQRSENILTYKSYCPDTVYLTQIRLYLI